MEPTLTERSHNKPCFSHVHSECKRAEEPVHLSPQKSLHLEPAPMAQAGPGTLLYRRNIRLDSFLKRNTERALYERIRACEPCVVKSDSINKVYMHVVMTDERVYLTEYPPRTLTCAFGFSSLRAIELINDLPDFLSGKYREQCQHIKVIYVPEKPALKEHHDDRLFPALPPSHSFSPLSSGKALYKVSKAGNYLCISTKETLRTGKLHNAHIHYRPRGEGEFLNFLLNHKSAQNVMVPNFLGLLNFLFIRPPIPYASRPTRSASCPNGETLGLLVPQPPARPHSSASRYPLGTGQRTKSTLSPKVPRRIGLLFSRRLKQNKGANIAELHFYAPSPLSTLYVHLQSSWTSFIIKSTLMLDPTYRRKYCTSPGSAAGGRPHGISWEQTAHLFSQLQSEVLREGISVERLYLLLQELRTAAQRNVALRRLFWRSNELCLFLVQTLEEGLPGDQNAVYTTDQLLMSTLVVQTLAVMFRETEVESARLSLLSANNGALVTRMLLALICDPGPQTPNVPQIDVCLTEYLDAACSLLFELLLQGQEKSKFSICDSILSVGWILQVLQPHIHLLSFIGYQTQQLVLVLSSAQHYITSPAQSILLFKRCRLLLASLQYSKHLTQYLMSNFRDNFKYSVNVVSVEMRLPPHYPISPLIRQLVAQILTLILH
ncbi:uncharacterized protein C12orf56 homolog [Eucyclogobius newberryi]|uniref:uncharacterized protein C12orf56 homolog n=1 Tax=Eucyclogobius newberryi TaxID=166745 RepID=UPI003B59BC8C